ncbi:MAG TPA: cysteine--tRNA ligase [Rhizomicrobium sp.]|nr:cysteine--tRNA ligase [Rhizomicrobium sp.]
MTLWLHNTLTRSKEEFAPLDPSNVRMYVCGPTVYDFAHIGNARPVIVFDLLFRLLRHLYGEAHVTYVRNITDIDDKINARAHELAVSKGVSVEVARAEITAKTAQQYNDDVAALGCLEPTYAPRATEYVAKMMAMIETLISSGHAYAEQGHVLFDVGSKPDYGKLANRSLDEMVAGARVDVAPYKRGPMDFVLWKPSDDETPGWESPWGRGRPGWHIECSAMGEALLGDTFDIHGGGIDLMFPHHENEIAQSECAHAGRPLARYWMHNGFLNVEGEKMSKSLGNFVAIRDLLDGKIGRSRSGEVLRFNMLRTHYHQPMNWTDDGIVESFEILKSLYENLNEVINEPVCHPPAAFLEALMDDLNTPRAISELHAAKRRGDVRGLYSALRVLGLSGLSGKVTINVVASITMPIEIGLTGYPARMVVARADGSVEIDAETRAQIQSLVDARLAARQAKDFKESDRIRDELIAKGIQLKDKPDGTTSWEVKR